MGQLAGAIQDRLVVRDNDMHLRRVRNASDAVQAGDYVTKRQLDAVEARIKPNSNVSISNDTAALDDLSVSIKGVAVSY